MQPLIPPKAHPTYTVVFAPVFDKGKGNYSGHTATIAAHSSVAGGEPHTSTVVLAEAAKDPDDPTRVLTVLNQKVGAILQEFNTVALAVESQEQIFWDQVDKEAGKPIWN
jgi:hypothetical protein